MFPFLRLFKVMLKSREALRKLWTSQHMQLWTGCRRQSHSRYPKTNHGMNERVKKDSVNERTFFNGFTSANCFVSQYQMQQTKRPPLYLEVLINCNQDVLFFTCLRKATDAREWYDTLYDKSNHQFVPIQFSILADWDRTRYHTPRALSLHQVMHLVG